MCVCVCVCVCVCSGVSLPSLERLELFRAGVALDHLKPFLNRGLDEKRASAQSS